jgi:NAD(P)H-dependent FMN reductase
MNIVAFLGSGRSESLTRQGLAAVLDAARGQGVQVDLVDLRDEYRALQDMADWDAPPAGSATASLRARVARADGIVLATPVYHGSYSGLLKNALDHLTGDAFARRAVGVLAASGGPRSGSGVCDQLRSVIRAMGGWSTPTQVGFCSADLIDGQPNAVLRKRAAAMVGELREFALGRHEMRRAA